MQTKPFEVADIPPLKLKALGQYPSERMTITATLSTIEVGSAIGSLAVPQATGIVGTAAITAQDVPYSPVLLHKIPGRPFNAFPIIKDVGILGRVTAGTTVTAWQLYGFLYFVDNTSQRQHLIGALNIQGGVLLTQAYENIILPASVLGEHMPRVWGSWLIVGILALGTATALAFDIAANLGVVYGAP